VDFPALRTRFRDRHALVVARGPGHKHDLRSVRPYVRDFKPVLIAVDGGADALLGAGHRPDVIVGDMDSVSDEALRCGAEIVVHAYPGGHAPGAELIVAVGTHFNLIEFLERNRAGMSSTFITRLRVGEILVDAKGVSRLVAPRAALGPFLALAVAGLAAICVAIAASPALRHLIEVLVMDIRDALGL